jgi:hypothetical protein
MPVDLEIYIIQSKLLDSFQDGGASKTRFLSTAIPKTGSELLRPDAEGQPQARVLDIQSNSIDKLISAEIAAFVRFRDPADASVAIVTSDTAISISCSSRRASISSTVT